MITLKHLVAGRIPTNLGPSAEGWTRTLRIFLLIVVVADCRDVESLSLPPLAKWSRISAAASV